MTASREWKGAAISKPSEMAFASHVVQMVEDAYQVALAFGDCLLLLDRYFLTVPALEKLKTLNSSGAAHMEIITKAKKFCTAYEKPGSHRPGQAWEGTSPKKGASIRLKELFTSHKERFQDAEIELYGKKESIRYYCIDLLWG